MTQSLAALSKVETEPPAPSGADCAIYGSDSRVLLGNVFLKLRHIASGETWRGLLFDRRRQVYVFRRLPAGEYLLSAIAKGHRWAATSFRLEQGQTIELELSLAKEGRDLLLLDKPPDAGLYLRARSLLLDADARSVILARASSLGLSHETSILLSLLGDSSVQCALLDPRGHCQASPTLIESIRGQILRRWQFPTTRSTDADCVSGLISNRLRVCGLTQAIFANREVAARNAVDRALIADCLDYFLAAVDWPELGDVLTVLTHKHSPGSVPVGAVVRFLSSRITVRPGNSELRASKERTPAGRGEAVGLGTSHHPANCRAAKPAIEWWAHLVGVESVVTLGTAERGGSQDPSRP